MVAHERSRHERPPDETVQAVMEELDVHALDSPNYNLAAKRLALHGDYRAAMQRLFLAALDEARAKRAGEITICN